MGSQYKPSNMDGVATVSNVKVVESSKRVMFKSSDVMLRILGFSLTFIAAIVVGVDKETKIISFTLAETMPSVQVSVTAKWQFMSAFVIKCYSKFIRSIIFGIYLGNHEIPQQRSFGTHHVRFNHHGAAVLGQWSSHGYRNDRS
ncbi:CASP-like protein 1E1 isoform X2 [Citrus clementina]|uniref:CASP-like protein 1E1 isoform X2 n=1 Tax=Citrus clementina TaxID=85681 RepID=UPI000CED4056|nr:CASP-like protein 1E1 isoform X2 [Citrus x clementina]